MLLCKKIFLFFFLIFIICGCKKKDENLSIKGTVYDPNSKVYVANAKVIISASKIENGVFNPTYQDLETTTTDGSGKFNFSIVDEKVVGYRISIRKDHYFNFSVDINPEDITSVKTYSPTYNIYPEAFIKLHIKNIYPYDNNDLVTYSFTSEQPSGYQCCTKNTFAGHGYTYDSTVTCKTYGACYVKANWRVTKYNSDVLYNDSIYCNASDTNLFNIYY